MSQENNEKLSHEDKTPWSIKEDELDIPIWRYMDFSKYVDILENSTLFFSSISGFEDKLEGLNNAYADNLYYGLHNNENGKPAIFKTNKRPDNDQALKDSIGLKQFVKQHEELWLKSIGINCWRIDKVESHAMWKAYLKSNEGVAIKSNVRSIKKSITLNEFQVLRIGKVQYIDYDSTIIDITKNPLSSIHYKSNYFNYENELRLIYYEKETISNKLPNYKKSDGLGYMVSINIEMLITEVIVSPYAPRWFYSLVEKITKNYIPKVPVTLSGIQLR